MTVSGTNFGKAASDYGTFRAGFPDSFFDRLDDFGIGFAGQSVVDLGTGTGSLARGFARRGCKVTGVDADDRMLAQSRQLDEKPGIEIAYVHAKAEATGIAAGSADVVTAGQCWHWFDRPRTVAEVHRILHPGGKLVIAHFDWLPLPGNMVEATESLIRKYNPDWNLGGGVGLYPQWIPDLNAASMRNIQTFSYDVEVPYSPEAWRGRIRASAGIAALDAAATEKFDADHRELLARHFPGNMLAVPHRVFAIIAETKGIP